MEIRLDNDNTTIIDDDDYDLVKNYSWHTQCHIKGKKFAAYSFFNSKGKNDVLYMHRLLLNAKKGERVEHINGNTLDNRRSNLRISTSKRINIIKGLSKANTSGFKGVSWAKEEGKWRVSITVDNKVYYVGLYRNKLEAARAYDWAALQRHGPEAMTNKKLGLIG